MHTQQLHTAYQAFLKMEALHTEPDLPDEKLPDFLALVRVESTAQYQIADTPAATLEDVLAKIVVLAEWENGTPARPGEKVDFPGQCDDARLELAQSARNDLARLLDIDPATLPYSLED